jgi:hypothetical protein
MTENLHEALRTLLAEAATSLWVDAICIDASTAVSLLWAIRLLLLDATQAAAPLSQVHVLQALLRDKRVLS